MKALMVLALAGLLAGCASYDDQGGTSSGSDRILGTGATSDPPARGGTDLGGWTNGVPREGTGQGHGRLGDSPH